VKREVFFRHVSLAIRLYVCRAAINDTKTAGEFSIKLYVTDLQKLLATGPEARVRFPALPEKKIVGLERAPLSLVSTTEELHDRKVAAPV
jgi:hypothetical protein